MGGVSRMHWHLQCPHTMLVKWIGLMSSKCVAVVMSGLNLKAALPDSLEFYSQNWVDSVGNVWDFLKRKFTPSTQY